MTSLLFLILITVSAQVDTTQDDYEPFEGTNVVDGIHFSGLDNQSTTLFYKPANDQNEWTTSNPVSFNPSVSTTFRGREPTSAPYNSTSRVSFMTSETQAYGNFTSTWPSSWTPNPYPQSSPPASGQFTRAPDYPYQTQTRYTPLPTAYSSTPEAEQWTASKFATTVMTPLTRPFTTRPPYTQQWTTSSPTTTTTRTPSTTTVPITFPTTTVVPFQPIEGARGSQDGQTTIMYDSLEHWLQDFQRKLNDQRNQVYNTRVDLDQDNNRYRAKNRAERLLRTISINQENVRRLVMSRQDRHSVNAIRRQEGLFCQYGHTYWPLATRTVKCGTGYVSGDCCVTDKSCLQLHSSDSVYPRIANDNRTDQIAFVTD